MRCVLVLLVVSVGGLGGAGASGSEASALNVDYVAKLNELVTKGTDENLNAAPLYERAFQAYVESSIPLDGEDIRRWPTELPADKQRTLRDWVASNAEALDRLRLGTQRAGYWFQYHGDDMWDTGRNDNPARMRELFWALVFRAKSRAVDGDVTGAVEDVLTGYRFAIDMRQRLFFHEQMVGVALLSFPLEATFQILKRAEVDPALLESLRKGITRISKRHDGRVDLRAEELLAQNAIQFAFARFIGTPTFSRTDEADRAAAQISAALGVEMSAEELYASLVTHYPDGLKDLAAKGYAHYSKIVRKTPLEWKRQGIDFDEEVDEWTGGNLLLRVLVPAVDLASTISFRCQATQDALATTLALLRYENNKGQFPVGLSELVSAGYLGDLPMDPYSGAPLVYRRTPDSFLLYSLGADFDDDGGARSRWGQDRQGGDQVFWPVSDNGALP